MCKCKELLTHPVINKPYQGKTVRKANILNPKMRIFFNETTHPREMSIKPNFCPWCGDKLKPVKLNAGLLSLYGFKKDGLGYMWIDLMTHWLSLREVDGYFYPLYAQVPEMSHEMEQRVFMNRIESLHELQNLFFAITGQKLELKNERPKVLPKTKRSYFK